MVTSPSSSALVELLHAVERHDLGRRRYLEEVENPAREIEVSRCDGGDNRGAQIGVCFVAPRRRLYMVGDRRVTIGLVYRRIVRDSGSFESRRGRPRNPSMVLRGVFAFVGVRERVRERVRGEGGRDGGLSGMLIVAPSSARSRAALSGGMPREAERRQDVEDS
jgi:hypothetical protein